MIRTSLEVEEHGVGRRTMTRVSSGPGASVSEIVAAARISDVYHALAGREPRSSGSNKWRGAAVWRDGEGLNVSLDDVRGLWHDFVTGQGGGVLDLVAQIRGGSRQDSLKWLGDFVGRPLQDSRLSAAERARWRHQRLTIESDLPNALLWKRGAIAFGEAMLDYLKGFLIDQEPGTLESGEIARWTDRVGAWRCSFEGKLIEEYLLWAESEPSWTNAVIGIARVWETVERRALHRFIRAMSERTEA